LLVTIPAVQQLLVTIPAVQQLLVTIPAVQQLLVAIPAVQQLLIGIPAVQALLVTLPDVQKILLSIPAVQVILLSLPEVQAILLADPTVEAIIFNDPTVIKTLFADPAVLQILLANPTILPTFFQNSAVQAQFLSTPQVVENVLSNPVVLQAFFLSKPALLDQLLAANPGLEAQVFSPASLLAVRMTANLSGSGNEVSGGLLSTFNLGSGSLFTEQLTPAEIDFAAHALSAGATPSQLQLYATAQGGNNVFVGGLLGNFTATGGGNNRFVIEDPSLLGLTPGTTLPSSLYQLGGTFNGSGGSDTFYFTGGSAGQQFGNVTLTETEPTGTPARDTLDFSNFQAGGINLNLNTAGPQTLDSALTLTLPAAASIATVIGTPGNDTILGNGAATIQGAAPDVADPNAQAALPPPAAPTQWVYLDFSKYPTPPASEANPAQPGTSVPITESLHDGSGSYTAADEQAILQGLDNIYAPFMNLTVDGHSYNLIQFTLDPTAIPAGTPYETVYFNLPPIVNGEVSPGGESDEIDFRNLNQNTAMQVDVNGFLGNGLGQVADTDTDFINLSTLVTAHELAHTLGLRHEDAYGPLGFGISSPPGANAYYPAYPGLVGAFTTDDHVITSPAAVGSTLADVAAGTAQFGEREAIDLAFIYAGTVVTGTNTSGDDGPAAVAAAPAQPDSVDLVNEAQLIAAGSQAAPAETYVGLAQPVNAEPVSLYQLSVPNTVTSGFGAGEALDVDAVDVLGHLSATQPDFYTFDGQSGASMNFYVKSQGLTRSAGSAQIDAPFDSVIYLYGPSGNLIAWNDDQFEPSDSSIIDFTLPSTGTYTVEVDSYAHASGGTGTAGDYELFMFHALAYNATSGADALYQGAPALALTTSPPAFSNQTTASISFSITNNLTPLANLNVRYLLDGQALPSGVSYLDASHATARLTGLSAGVHTFEIDDLDAAGNVLTSVATTWTIDTTPPSASVTSALPLYSISTAAAFSFTGTDNLTPVGALFFEASLDGSAFTAATSPVSYTSLSQGPHTFEVEAIDQAGNVSTPASYSWTVDTTAPTVSIASGPALYSNSGTASFNFGGSDNLTAASNLIYKVSLDGSAFTAAPSPVAYTSLNQGPHTFQVEDVDQAGNVSAAASYSWTTDTSAPTVSITANPLVYNGATNTFSTTFAVTGSDNITAASNLVFQVSLDGAAFAPATSAVAYTDLSQGTHTFQAEDIDQAGNVSAVVSYSFSATPNLTLTVADNGGIYTGASFPASGSVTGANAVNLGTPTFTYYQGSTLLTSAPSDAGTYTVVASYNSTSASASFTIAQATPAVAVTDAGGTYSGSAASASAATVTGIADPIASFGDSPLSYTYYQGPTVLAGAPVNAGTYTVVAHYAGSTDYAAANSAPVSFTISPAPLAVTVGTASQTYGQPANLATTLGSTLATRVNGETLGVTYASAGDTASADVGTYPITAQLSSGSGNPSNYSVTVTNGILTVTPAPLTIDVASTSHMYGQATNLAAALGSTILTGVNGENLNISYMITGGMAAVHAGTYDITAQVSSGTGTLANYSVTIQSGTLTVTPAPLTITAVSQTKPYAAAMPALTVAYSGFVNGDTSASLTTLPTVATTATTKETVSGYSLTASGAVDGDYAITYVAGTFNILPTPLIVTALNQTMVYGSTALPALAVSYSGFVNGDSATSLKALSVTTKATIQSSVGTYPITASDSLDSNYTITYVTGTFTVTPAPLTITVQPQTQVYGTVAATPAVTYSGFVNGDTTASFSTLPTVTSSAKATSGAGSNYTYSASGAVASNYTLTYVAGPLTILPATPTVMATDAGGTYDGALFAATAATVTGVSQATLASLSADSSTLSFRYYAVGSNNALTLLPTAPTNVGHYEVIAHYASDNGNYNNADSSAVPFSITPAALTIAATPDSKSYDGTTRSTATPTFEVNGLAPNTLYGMDTLAGLTQAFASKDVLAQGSALQVAGYTLTDGNGGANYTITTQVASGTITPAPLTISATTDSKTYDGTTGSTKLPTTSALFGTNTVTGLSQSFTSKNVLGLNPSTLAVNTVYSVNDGNSGKDYTVTLHTAAGTITPAPLSIIATSDSKTYDGTIGSAKTPTASGLFGSDTVSALSQAFASKNVEGAGLSKLAVNTGYSVNDGDGGKNYTVTLQSAAGTITPATLTVTASNLSRIFDVANSPLTYTLSGFVAGDSTSVVSGSPNLITTATTASPVGTYPIAAALGTLSAANYTFAFVNGTLTVTLTGPGTSSVYLLSSTAAGALTVSGSAALKVTGMVAVDSSSASAISASGAASVTAGSIQVVGRTQVTGSAHLSPSPVIGAGAFDDPLANLPVPSVSGTATAINLGGNSTLMIYPGVYSKIQLTGSAKLYLNPGVYVIAGGGLSVSGSASINGTGVMIYNAGSKYSAAGADGGTFGPLSFSGSAVMNLTPATTGTYAGIVIFQSRLNSSTISFSGSADPAATSIIYAPDAPVTLSGSAQVGSAQFQATLIANTLSLSGSTIFQVSAANGTTVYSPEQIRSAYGVNDVALDGAGQTIALVEAYDDPALYPSLDTFDTQFGLTSTGPSIYAQYGPASNFLSVANQNGQANALPGVDPSGAGVSNWELETALDVEWTHALAPGAHIVVVEANSQLLADLMAAVATAADLPGVSVVSMSWGFTEGSLVSASEEALYDSTFTTPADHQGVTFVASSGDAGTANPEYPAFSPNVVAVGGTSLYLNADNSYGSEVGWGAGAAASGGVTFGSGGGVSLYEAAPLYQQQVQATGYRTTPDVSFVADPSTGVAVADGYNIEGDNPWAVVGGTSLSAPAWAGLFALANEGRALEQIPSLNSASPTETQQALYNVPESVLNDITSGTNGGYSAGTGYDLVTGLGSPNANLLVPDLISYKGGTNSGRTITVTSGAGTMEASSAGPTNAVPAGVFNIFSAELVGRGHASVADVGAVSQAPAVSMPMALPTGAGGMSAASTAAVSPVSPKSVFQTLASEPARLQSGNLATSPAHAVVTGRSASAADEAPSLAAIPPAPQGGAFIPAAPFFVSAGVVGKRADDAPIQADGAGGNFASGWPLPALPALWDAARRPQALQSALAEWQSLPRPVSGQHETDALFAEMAAEPLLPLEAAGPNFVVPTDAFSILAHEAGQRSGETGWLTGLLALPFALQGFRNGSAPQKGTRLGLGSESARRRSPKGF
jgi:mucin-19